MAIQKSNWDNSTQQQENNNSLLMQHQLTTDLTTTSSVDTAQAMSVAYAASRMVYNIFPYTSAAVSANAAAAISATAGFYQNAAANASAAVMGMFQNGSATTAGPSFSGNGKLVVYLELLLLGILDYKSK